MARHFVSVPDFFRLLADRLKATPVFYEVERRADNYFAFSKSARMRRPMG